mgnify:FL=1
MKSGCGISGGSGATNGTEKTESRTDGTSALSKALALAKCGLSEWKVGLGTAVGCGAGCVRAGRTTEEGERRMEWECIMLWTCQSLEQYCVTSSATIIAQHLECGNRRT